VCALRRRWWVVTAVEGEMQARGDRVFPSLCAVLRSQSRQQRTGWVWRAVVQDRGVPSARLLHPDSCTTLPTLAAVPPCPVLPRARRVARQGGRQWCVQDAHGGRTILDKGPSSGAKRRGGEKGGGTLVRSTSGYGTDSLGPRDGTSPSAELQVERAAGHPAPRRRVPCARWGSAKAIWPAAKRTPTF
jgi:hypothetical protein